MSQMKSDSSTALSEYIVIGLLSFTVLLYELSIIRILSVVLWYHFAFLSISLAMLGLALPGVWYSLKQPTKCSLFLSLQVAFVSLPLSVFIILHGRKWFYSAPSSVWYIVLVVFSILIPMVSLGSGICLLLLRAKGERIGTMYGFDLLGGMIAALIILPLMFFIPTPFIMAACGFIPLLALALLSKRNYLRYILYACCLIGLMIWGNPFEVHYNKLYPETQFERLLEKWTPIGRVVLLKDCPFKRNQQNPWGWGWGTRFTPVSTRELWIDQDGSAGSPVENPDEFLRNIDFLMFDVTSIGCQIRLPSKVVVIGAGGGRDILTALNAGADSVDAVEINGAVVKALSGPFKDFSGDVYHWPGVTPVISDGRSYLAHTDKKYDVIQISLVDSWAATMAGAYALSENYLYTIEAFQLYFKHLADNGIISVSRYFAGTQQMEGTRLVCLAIEALERMGIKNVRQHIAVLQSHKVGTLLISLLPWSESDLERLRSVSDKRGFAVIWPTFTSANAHTDSDVYHAIVDGASFLTQKGFDMRPPTDDRPFFFQSFSLFGSDVSSNKTLGFNEFAVVVLQQVILVVVGLSLLLFVLPLFLTKSLKLTSGVWGGSLYFCAIGMGFMFVELPWIQRSILYLGNPSYAATCVIASFLAGAGVGSLIAARFIDIRGILKMAFILPLTIAAVDFVIKPVFGYSMGCFLLVRFFIVFILLFPVGVIMGFAFPVGMRYFGDSNKAWFWAMNAMASVLGSVLSLGIAMMYGFSREVLLGIIAYIIAVYVLRISQRIINRRI